MKRNHLYILASLFALALGACSSGDDSPNADVAGAKQFVGDIRTWNTTIDNEVNSNSNATTFQTRVNVANQIFDSVGVVLNTGMDIAIQAAAQAYQTKANVDLSIYNSTTPFISATGTATISGNTITVAGTVTSMTADLVPVQQDSSVDLTFVFPANIGTNFTASITGTSVGGGASLAIQTGTVTFVYASATDLSPWIADPSLPNFPAYENASMDLTVILQETGQADPVGFTGTIGLDVVPVKSNGNNVLDSNGDPMYAVQDFLMSGTFGNTANYFNATMGAGFPNAGSYVEPADGIQTADMYQQIQDATISFTATLEGLPSARFAITANRMSFGGGIGQVEISYGIKKITFTLEELPNDDARATFTVTDGVNTLSMVAQQSSPTGSIYYNGVKIGTISDNGSGVTIITYVDGSIESLQ